MQENVSEFKKGKFKEWLLTTHSPEILAARLGVSRSTISHWVNGKFVPRADKALRIIEISKGQLTLEDIVRG